MPYNGFPNYETWAVCTHLNDDPVSQQWVRKLAQDAWDDTPPVGPDQVEPTSTQRTLNIAVAVEAVLRGELQDEAIEGDGSWRYLAGDLLGAALGRVEWEHIAGHLADEILEQERAEA